MEECAELSEEEEYEYAGMEENEIAPVAPSTCVGTASPAAPSTFHSARFSTLGVLAASL